MISDWATIHVSMIALGSLYQLEVYRANQTIMIARRAAFLKRCLGMFRSKTHTTLQLLEWEVPATSCRGDVRAARTAAQALASSAHSTM